MGWTKQDNKTYNNGKTNVIQLRAFRVGDVERWFFYDSDNSDVKIDILDFFNNPVFNPNPNASFITITESIPEFSPVGIDGKIPDSNKIEDRFKLIGLVTSAAAINDTVQYRYNGEASNQNWNWTPGLPVFLNGKTLSHNAPKNGFIIEIGVSKDAKTLILNIKESIKLFS
ncbi:MAG: hypothetical protein SFU98_16350 [Leptospiraceae bacterium]|nr:hypothetical protein [Leptospiraceae bacterium]